MKIKDILRELQYYLSIRRTGKTTLLKKGIDEYPYYHWIVVPTIEYGKTMVIPSNKLHKLVSLDDIGSGNGSKIRGTHQAMIIDQEANLQIFQMAFGEIQRLEDESVEKTKLAHEIAKLVEMYQDDLHKLQNHFLNGLKISCWNLFESYRYKKKSIELMDYTISNNKRYSEQFKRIKSHYRFEI
jgi:hypothetical protein